MSSGNLIADRRYEWARGREQAGDLAAAADLLTQALELAPEYASAWFALGEVRERLGERADAIEAFRKAAAADAQDRHGATLHLARLGAAEGTMPPAYVRALFDGYAPAFDDALTSGLDYRGPALLLDAVKAVSPRMKFGSLLDLGCGTGLSGAAFRPFCDWLVGVDLSPAMLAEARKKGLYDRLIEGDVLQCLAAEADAKAQYHLVIAADVVMYLPQLAPVLKAAANVLAPGGLLAFTAETHEGSDVILRDTLRYAHGERHLRDALAAAKLNTVSLSSASTRNEKGAPVPSLVVVAAK